LYITCKNRGQLWNFFNGEISMKRGCKKKVSSNFKNNQRRKNCYYCPAAFEISFRKIKTKR